MLKITKNQGSIQVTADKSGFYPFDGTITFPTNSLFTATSANTDMITFKSTSNGDVQFVGNYKDITISGRSYDTKQKFLTAFSNLANQGSVDAYTKAETDAKLNDKLTAQTNANGSLFISSSSNDDANSSVALYNSTVKGSNDVAIQLASTPDKEGMHNLAILNMAQANGIQNIAIGAFQRCKGISNIGIGVGASNPNTVDVNGQGNVCIGASSQAHTDNNNAVNESIAIGSGANASNDYCTVIGPNATSYSSHVVAIGKDAHADSVASWSVAVGDSARAHGERSVAIGNLSYATNETPLDICCGKRADNSPLRVLQSDATGKLSILKGDGSIERMVIQDEIEALKNAGGGGTVDAYTKAETDTKLDAKQDKLTAGSGITITKDETAGTSTIATAVSLTDNGNGAYQVGDSIKMGSDNVAIGKYAYSYARNSVAIGSDAHASAEEAVAIGYYSVATNDTPLVIRAGYKIVGNSKKSLTVLQSDANGKISIIKGDDPDERMVIQDEIEALKNAGGSGGGTVDAYTKTETDALLNAKQNTLTAGTGITIDENNVISSTGGSGGSANPLVNVKGPGSATIPDNVTEAVAIGSGARTSSGRSVAIGYKAETSAGTPMVINASSKTMIQSDANGKISLLKGDGTNERMVIQDEIAALKNAGGSGGANPYVNVKGTDSATILDTVTNAVAIGSDAYVSGDKAVAIGTSASAGPDFPLVINAGAATNGNAFRMIQGDKNGKVSIPLGDGTVAMMCLQDEIEALKNAGGSGGSGGSANPLVNVKGPGSATITDNVTEAVAIGSGANVSRNNGVSVGYQCKSGDSSVAIGRNTRSESYSSIAIGDGANTGMFINNNTIAVGTNARANSSNSLAIGKNATTSTDTPMVINAGGKTMIQGDKAGKISIPLGDGTASTMCIQDEIAALKAEIAALKGGASTGDASGDTTGA